MLARLLEWLGVEMTTITRMEAAQQLLGVDVRVRWSPLIITEHPRGEQ